MNEAPCDILFGDYPEFAHLDDGVIASYASLDDDDPRAYIHYRDDWFVVSRPMSDLLDDSTVLSHPGYPLEPEMRETLARLRSAIDMWRSRYNYTAPIVLAHAGREYVPADIRGLYTTADDAKKERAGREIGSICATFIAMICASILRVVTRTIAQLID